MSFSNFVLEGGWRENEICLYHQFECLFIVVSQTRTQAKPVLVMYPDGMHDVHIISVGIMFYLLSKLQWYGTHYTTIPLLQNK